jgi:integrase
MVRKIASGKEGARVEAICKAKARLGMIAYTGVSHAELKRLTPDTVSVEGQWINTGRRRKGKGKDTGPREISAEGAVALARFVAANAFGTFANTVLYRSYKRAVEKVIAALEATPDGEETAAALRRLKTRPYDFRHSYGTETYLYSDGNGKLVQRSLGHASEKTGERYTKGALSAVHRAALDRASAAGAFKGRGESAAGQRFGPKPQIVVKK